MHRDELSLSLQVVKYDLERIDSGTKAVTVTAYSQFLMNHLLQHETLAPFIPNQLFMSHFLHVQKQLMYLYMTSSF